jgi:hypothetical protein
MKKVYGNTEDEIAEKNAKCSKIYVLRTYALRSGKNILFGKGRGGGRYGFSTKIKATAVQTVYARYRYCKSIPTYVGIRLTRVHAYDI